jgi:hypothetical protein
MGLDGTDGILLVKDGILQRLSGTLDVVQSWTLPTGIFASYARGWGGDVALGAVDRATRTADTLTLASHLDGLAYNLLLPDGGIIAMGYSTAPAGVVIANNTFVPLARHLASDGGIIATYPSPDGATGETVDGVLTPDNTVVLVGTEDVVSRGQDEQRWYTPSRRKPDAYPGLCSVYGCEALVVREWTLDGQLLWEYLHRSQSSRGLAVNLRGDGSVRVMGKLHGEVDASLVLDFSR